MPKSRAILLSSTAIALFVAAVLFLRPSGRTRRWVEMAPPGRIPPAARAVIASKMHRHAEQMPVLLMDVVVLDYGGVARAAGEMFDEPALARPMGGEELNGLLPERFFELQDALRARMREVVTAAARHDGIELSTAFGDLTKTCVLCHTVYASGS